MEWAPRFRRSWCMVLRLTLVVAEAKVEGECCAARAKMVAGWVVVVYEPTMEERREYVRFDGGEMGVS